MFDEVIELGAYTCATQDHPVRYV